MKVTWFRHSHENRNDLLRFGFMRLHYNKEITYIERPFSEMSRFGFSQKIVDYPDPRHQSFILVEAGSSKIKCLVDNEDSFVLISPLVAEVDVCFCAGYNADFFERRQFVQAYAWQEEADIKGYRELLQRKIEQFGHHFYKIKRFVPIAPNQGGPVPVPHWKQKIKNIEHRFNRVVGKGTDFFDVYRAFEIRESYLKGLRNSSLEYDVVLHDSLWGWPQHRVNLHQRLSELYEKQYRIHSLLNWNAPVDIDGSDKKGFATSCFPMKTAPIHEGYEVMLSKSKLAVFACGFHWGWRNIMMLALQAGIPVMTDRLLTEPYFDMNEFKIFQQEDHKWSALEPVLTSYDAQQWQAWKRHNQGIYDKYMSPEIVAGYFINSLS